MPRESAPGGGGDAEKAERFARRRGTAGLILAAGKGTRFASESAVKLPKVLQPLLGRPMILYVVEALRAAGVRDITIVIGCQAEAVAAALGDRFDYVVQREQKGSGHAVMCASDRFRGFEGLLVVMCGDSPLFRAQTVRAMVDLQRDTQAAVVLASAVLDNPAGYGRIVRDGGGRIAAIVEEKCAGAEQRAIKEVNGGAYVFEPCWLFANVDRMAQNEVGEYNLTDMVRVAAEQGRLVQTVPCDPVEILGVNTPEELRAAEAVLRRRASRGPG